MRRNEKQVIMNILDDLIVHFTNNQSLLVKIYGVYTITTKYFGSIDIILMENCFKNRNNNNPFMLFDLKGSTYKNRYTHVREKLWWKTS